MSSTPQAPTRFTPPVPVGVQSTKAPNVSHPKIPVIFTPPVPMVSQSTGMPNSQPTVPSPSVVPSNMPPGSMVSPSTKTPNAQPIVPSRSVVPFKTPPVPMVSQSTRMPTSQSTITTVVEPTKPSFKTLQEQGIPIPRPVEKESVKSNITADTEPSPVQDVATDTEPTPIKRVLTIYSNSGHMIETRSGEPIITLPKSVDRSTILVLGDDGSVVDFEYRPGTDLSRAVNNRTSGERVEVTVVKGDTKITGTILELGSDAVTLVKDSEITHVRNYDRISLNASNDYVRPRLLLTNSGAKSVTVSYLLGSVSWRCSGTAIINGNIMHLRLSGTIDNNTETDIMATVKLVAGDVQEKRRFSESTSRVMLSAATPMRRNTAASSLVEDYTSYDVGARTIRSESVAELGVWDIPVNKIYVHDTSSYDEVRYGYRFKATTFLPECGANVYAAGTDQAIGSYMGSGHMDESQKDDEVDIMLGGSTIVQCQSDIVVDRVDVTDEKMARRYQLTFGPQQWSILTTTLTTTISNVGSDPANLILRHPINDSKLVRIDCRAFKQRSNGYIEWVFQLSPQQRNEKFVCTIVTAQLI